MNKINETNIRIKKDILAIAFCGKYKASFAKSSSARELYVLNRLRLTECAPALCVALGKNASFKAEMLANSDMIANPHKFADIIINFAEESSASGILLGFYTLDIDELISSDEFSRYIGTVYVLLKRHGIALEDALVVSEHNKYSIFNEDI